VATAAAMGAVEKGAARAAAATGVATVVVVKAVWIAAVVRAAGSEEAVTAAKAAAKVADSAAAAPPTLDAQPAEVLLGLGVHRRGRGEHCLELHQVLRRAHQHGFIHSIQDQDI